MTRGIADTPSSRHMTYHILIKGKVQGVFYRASARDRAVSMRITGWVRNTPEGHVEILAKGTQADLEALIAWCRQGPPKAKVTEVEIHETEEISADDFKIVR